MQRVACIVLVSILVSGHAADLSEYDKYVNYVMGTGGCMRKFDGYEPEMEGFDSVQPTLQDCSARCNITAGCLYYMFANDTGSCRLAPWYARVAHFNQLDLVTGAVRCEPRSPCLDLPRDGFPGDTPELSNRAWVSGRPPMSTECWPKDGAALIPCLDLTILEDATDASLPSLGACSDLAQTSILADACEAECKANTHCSVWEEGADGTCFQGKGKHCFTPGSIATKAQRIMHGDIRVLMNLGGLEITSGLSQAFDNGAFAIGGFFSSQADAVVACKNVCYSDVDCEYWMFSSEIGCWVEDKSVSSVPYPLTLSSSTRESEEALLTMGEYIKHYCPDNETDTPSREAWCSIHGTRWLPDMNGQGATVEPDVARCQQRCVDTVGCARFSFYPGSLNCFLQDEHATENPDYTATSGLKVCPDEAIAVCSAHPVCANQEGYCCPNKYGLVDPCCDETIMEVDDSTDKERTIVVEDDDDNSSIDWWVVLLVLLGLLSCCLAVLMLACRDKEEEEESDPDILPLHETTGFDRSKLPFPESSVSVSQHVPFPEAGVRNPNMLPFPRAGLASDFEELHPDIAREGLPPMASSYYHS